MARIICGGPSSVGTGSFLHWLELPAYIRNRDGTTSRYNSGTHLMRKIIVRESDHSAIRFCVWCGSEFAPEARFCADCGHSIADSIQAPHTPPPDWIAEPDVEETIFLDDLAHVSDHEHRDEPASRTRRFPRVARNWYLVAAAALALLLVVGMVALFAVRGAQERPVREAFEAAQESFSPDVRRLGSASDMNRVQAAGQRFAADLGLLQAQERALAASTHELARASRPVVAAQVAYAAAASELAEVPADEFTWWGQVHSTLDKAARELEGATKRLATVDEEAAQTVAAGTGALSSLEEVVGTEVADGAQQRLTGLLGELTAASATAGVREVASAANLEGAAVKAAADSLPADSRDGKRLEVFSAVYPAIGALAVLDADHLDEWASLRAPLTAALAAADPDVLDPSAGRTAVASIERIVERGKAELADWRLSYDTAMKSRAQDLRALQSYRADMDSQLGTYSSLRSELSRWVDTVESPSSYVTYDDAYRVLAQASSDRWAVREKMASLTIPPEAMATHRGLMSVLDDAISAVDSAYEGASDADLCIASCYYRDTPGWQQFSAESARITGAFDRAVTSWEAGASSAERAIARRVLPKQPIV